MADTRIRRRAFAAAWWAVWLFVAVLGAAYVATTSDDAAISAADQAALPPDLALVPADALGFVRVRAADLWNSEAGKMGRQQLAKEADALQHEVQAHLGVAPDDIERATVLMLSAKDEAPLVIVMTAKPYTRAKVLEAVAPQPQEHKHAGKTYYTSKQSGRAAVHFVNDRVFLVGQVEDVVQTFVHLGKAGAENPLGSALTEAAQERQIVAGVRVPTDAVEQGKTWLEDGPGAAAKELAPLLKAQTIVLTADFGPDTAVQTRLIFADEAGSGDGLKAMRAGFELARKLIKPFTEQADKDRDVARLVPLLKLADAALQMAVAEQKGTTVQAGLHVKTDVAAVAAAMRTAGEAVAGARRDADRARSVNNLKQMAIAMHNHHDTQGTFPAHAIYSKDGKPLLSWRVALLPYVEGADLYKEFKLDEPWDSEHNKALLDRMPPVYQLGQVKPGANKTFYQAFVGKSAFFEGKKGLKISDITDGTSNTLMIVEARDAVPWTKPEDLPYDAAKPLPPLGGFFDKGFNAAYCDGSVRFLSKDIKEKTLRALITRNGGEVIEE